MKKLKKIFLDKSAINIGLPILIIALYLSLFLPPKIRQIARLSPKVAQLKTKIINLEKEWANIGSFKEKISHLNKELDDYEKKLPNEKEIPVVLEYLSDSAKKLDVKITEIKPAAQEQEKEQLYYSVPILVKAECGYHQLGRFINELERSDRFMKISDINIKSGPHQRNTLDIQLIVVTYVMTNKDS